MGVYRVGDFLLIYSDVRSATSAQAEATADVGLRSKRKKRTKGDAGVFLRFLRFLRRGSFDRESSPSLQPALTIARRTSVPRDVRPSG